MSDGASIVRMHHAQITIPPDYEAIGRDFYCGVLGLRQIPKPEALAGRGGFWLQVGDQQLHVGVEDGVKRSATKAHIAYEVNDLGPPDFLPRHARPFPAMRG